jgi:L-lactate utilization protein LutC
VETLWSIFTAKAELVGAAVLRTATPAAANALLREADVRHTAQVARQFPEVAAGRPVAAGEPFAEVVSAAEFGVAETGSVAVDEARQDRAACFLAERLWVLVSADQVVPTLDEALLRMRGLVRGGSRHPLLMTGPSRTADIERTLTLGAHGPRALVVVVVGPHEPE